MKKPENFKTLFYSLAQNQIRAEKSKMLVFDKTEKAEYPAKKPSKWIIHEPNNKARLTRRL